MTSLVKISKIQASTLGLGFIFLTSNIILLVYYCRKTNKIIKIKAMFAVFTRNYVYFLKLFFIISFFKPKVIIKIMTFVQNRLNYLFYLVLNKIIDLPIKNDFVFYLGLYAFRIVLLPLCKMLLTFFNFVCRLKLFDSFIFLEAFLLVYGRFWYVLGFCESLVVEGNFYKKFKMFSLNFLGLLINTLYLLVNFILIDRKTGKLVCQNLLKALRGDFFVLFLNFYNSLKIRQKNLQSFWYSKGVIINSLVNNKLKIQFLIIESINLVYFICVWVIRLWWIIYLSRSIKLIVTSKSIKKLVFKN
jgi:hypothetical protein